MSYLLHLNDSCLSLWHGEQLFYAEPGVAYVHGKQIDTGLAARAQMHLNPRQVFQQFWQGLSLEPLAPPTPPLRHNADLAYAQMSQMIEAMATAGVEDKACVIAIPASTNAEQMSLLLGMTQRLGLEVKALIDSGVLTLAGQQSEGQSIWVDMHQHQTLVYRFTHDAGTRFDHWQQVAIGEHHCMDKLAHVIAEAFIAEQRFDPFHAAESEQYLFDHLPGWLQQLANKGNQGSLRVEIPAGDGWLATQINSTDLARSLNTFTESLSEAVKALSGLETEQMHLFMPEQLGLLPGISNWADGSNLNNTWLSNQLLPQQFLRYKNSLLNQDEGAGASYITQLADLEPLPEKGEVAENVSEKSASTSEQPTHLLVNGYAYPLNSTSASDSEIPAEVKVLLGLIDASGQLNPPRDGKSLLLNSEPVEYSQTLAVADRLSAPDLPEGVLIRVVEAP